MKEIVKNKDYKKWLLELKTAIKQTQLKAAVAVNSQLIMLYWDMGRQIVEKQENAKWGSGFIDQLSKDLKMEFPDTGGFSVSNIYEIVKFYKYFSTDIEIFQQAVGKIENGKPKKRTGAKFQQAVGKIAHTKVQQVAGEMKHDATLQLCKYTGLPTFQRLATLAQ
jgi:DUF1016 N-terminal domain